jgi:hypothetical protein
MNAHQRRKHLRKLARATGSPHRFIRDWADLAQVPESPTHRLEIDVERCNGWVHDKSRAGDEFALGRYLSTHTFYGTNHKHMTRLLRKCGFNVTLANWDAKQTAA